MTMGCWASVQLKGGGEGVFLGLPAKEVFRRWYRGVALAIGYAYIGGVVGEQWRSVGFGSSEMMAMCSVRLWPRWGGSAVVG